MIKDEVVENLVSEVEEDSHRSKIKEFLNGEIDNFLDINKKSLKFVNNFKMENYMEEDVFFESETGEILLKYFRYMYNNFPNELSYQFSNFPLKYKIFKLLNFSEEFVKKDFENVKVVVNGAGAAGMAITRLLQSMNTKNIILCDRMGAIYSGRTEDMNPYKQEIAEITNAKKEKGMLSDVIKGADVFIGVSTAGCLTQDMARTMNKDAVVLAMANPLPEIMPDDAKKAGIRIICTGRSDFPNQVNNLLAFPGIFRGALDVRASCINLEMKIAAAHAIASLVTADKLCEEFVIPDPFDRRVAQTVAEAVKNAAKTSGVARI